MKECILEDTWGDIDIDCSDEEGSYIEIELDTVAPTCYNDDQNKNSCMDDDEEHEEYQLRISISSSINVHTNEPKVATIGAPCISSLMNCPYDTTRTCADSKAIKTPLQHSSVSKIDEAAEFPVQNRLLSFNPVESWESPQPDGQTTILRTTRVIPYENVDMLHASRKQPSMTTTTTTNGIMMKLLIKFQGIKIGALLASLLKPRQPCQANNRHKSSNKSKTFFQCYQKRLVNPSNGRCTTKKDQGRRSNKHYNLEDDSTCGIFRSSKKFNRAMEMNLGSLRGIFNAKGMNIANKSRSSKRRSGSTSCNTSPIHEGFPLCSSSHENSIQAAIAHCKSSFGQTSDFTFTSSISSSPSRSVAYPD